MRRALVALTVLAGCGGVEHVDVTGPAVAPTTAPPTTSTTTTTTVAPTTTVPTTAAPRPKSTTTQAVEIAEALVIYRTVWDALSECESGGNWSSNVGLYDGGLQFHPDTWRRAGGTRYAPYAWQATREQQIAVAESWLARTSWAQWPACSARLGLR